MATNTAARYVSRRLLSSVRSNNIKEKAVENVCIKSYDHKSTMATRIAARYLSRRLSSSVTSNHLKDKAAKNVCTKVETSSNEVENLRKQQQNLLEEHKKLATEIKALSMNLLEEHKKLTTEVKALSMDWEEHKKLTTEIKALVMERGGSIIESAEFRRGALYIEIRRKIEYAQLMVMMQSS